MHIYLTGFMGSGKTTVGARLAAMTGRELVDLDERIVQQVGRTIPEIFRTDGERWFREVEHRVLRSVAAPGAVVATGGGTPLLEANRRWMKRHGFVVWLHPSLETIVARIGGRGKADRPLFESEEQVFALYRSRLPAYREADLVLDVGSEETADEVAARLRLLIPEATCGT